MRMILILAGICLFSVPQAMFAESAGMELMTDGSIKDSSGRVLKIEKPFARIISLYGAHTENLVAMGAADFLTGVARGDGELPGISAKQKFSAHDGPERFLAARPDLVIIRPMIDRGYATLIERLENFGITVVSLQPGTVDEMRIYWKILGRLAGKEESAEKMIERFDAGVAEARSISSGLESRKKVYFEAIHDRFKTFSPGAMPLFALECAGGINVAQDAEPVRGTNIAAYGKERILSRAGEIDVYLAQAGVMNRVDPAEICREPGYRVIKAVREKKVYLVDEKIVSRPTLRLLEGICRIGEILYPGKFDEDARKIIMQAGGQ